MLTDKPGLSSDSPVYEIDTLAAELSRQVNCDQSHSQLCSGFLLFYDQFSGESHIKDCNTAANCEQSNATLDLQRISL